MTGALRQDGSRSAFTLIEALCTLAIVALILSATFGALTMTVRSVERARETLRRSRVTSGIARVLRRDFNAVCGASEKKLPALEAGGFGNGTRLAFFSTRSLALRGSGGTPGLYRIEYTLRPSDRLPGLYQVLRMETPYTVGKPLDRSRSAAERLADGVSFWRLRFYDGTEWHDQWKRKKLPTSVRLDIAIGEADVAPERAQSLYFVPLVSPEADPLP